MLCRFGPRESRWSHQPRPPVVTSRNPALGAKFSKDYVKMLPALGLATDRLSDVGGLTRMGHCYRRGDVTGMHSWSTAGTVVDKEVCGAGEVQVGRD